ncbi:Piso0_000114 [Millerozyma farinosa CBS 7064]|uniref:Piso0_000114 protein n=1 Tax=Pichia sorbitophila (strain ATCC MYA-4447 / BCRC 22081 / CBS 7064 / NBRC 10061 / NRRL Y-12695) TaxID=559304 RepID=G8YT44_PICSO|nr:Piso0_000114 [Millerozyma farinosa CBS 7064]
MTVEKTWFEDEPLQQYAEMSKKSAENVPESAPEGDEVGGHKVKCGPLLKLLGTLENGQTNYRGSLMVVVEQSDVRPSVTYQVGPAAPDAQAAVGSGELAGQLFYQELGLDFWKFDIELELAAHEQLVKYALNGDRRPWWKFFVPSQDQSMNVISYSCNGFSLSTDTAGFKNSLWLDVLEKHAGQHYHVMLGGGDQIYSDAIKVHSEHLQGWMEESNPLKKRSLKPDDNALREMNEFYLKNYMGWFGSGFWQGTNGSTLQTLFPVAMAQIPMINIYDDHDIIDGFGSYHDMTMKQPYFMAIGNVAYKYYMIFQHFMTPDEEVHNSIEAEPSWILSKQTGPFIKQKNHSNYVRLGKEISLLGLDCRTERKLRQIVDPSTYNLVFDRLEREIKNAPEVKHLLVMLGVPILYPRLVWLEWLLNSPLLKPFKMLAVRGIINKGLVNEFDGGVEVLDDLNDHWCSKNHKRERNYLVKRLIEFGAAHGVRVTILSGDVHLCCIGRLRSKVLHHPNFHLSKHLDKGKYVAKDNNEDEQAIDVVKHPEMDPRLIFNVISSAMVNAAPPNPMAALLDKRSKLHHYDRFSIEDIVPIFTSNTDGSKRDNKRFLNKRNWSDLVIATQSVHNDKVDAGIERLPSSTRDVEHMSSQPADTINAKYPLLPDSLVVNLRVEDDSTLPTSSTAAYELFIPRLAGTFKLDRSKIKHLS